VGDSFGSVDAIKNSGKYEYLSFVSAGREQLDHPPFDLPSKQPN